MKTITIRMEVAEMMYDIQNKTYLTGRSREAEEVKGYEAASHMQASDDDENAYQIRRSIANRFGELRTAVAEYLDEASTSADNMVDEAVDRSEALTVTLTMPGNYNNAATAGIAAGMHGFIVNSAIADWFTITNKADAADYTALAQKSMEAMRKALFKRVRPSRKVDENTGE